MKKFPLFAALAVTALLAAPTIAKEPAKGTEVLSKDEIDVPVYPHDMVDRPYEVIGEVKAGVRKATIFSKAPDQKKIYEELWERGEKMGADAIINAKYGDAKVTAFSWGKSKATGTAIRFIKAPAETGEEAAAPTETAAAEATADATDAPAEATEAPAPEASKTEETSVTSEPAEQPEMTAKESSEKPE